MSTDEAKQEKERALAKFDPTWATNQYDVIQMGVTLMYLSPD